MVISKWRLFAGAATASLCLAAANSSSATTAWANTHTQAIPLVKATLLGALDPATPMRISVALQMQNTQALQTLVQHQATPGDPDFNKYITPAQFNATYAPSGASVNAVTSYLASMGLSNISVTPNNLFVTATGTAGQVEAAFNTSLSRFKQKGKQVFVNTLPVQVPQALNGIVISVLGLNNVAATSPITQCDVSNPQCLRFTYNPETYWRAYDARTVTRGSKTSIAVMAEGDVSGVIPDLRTFESAMGLPQVKVTVVPVGLASTDTAGADEWDLDTQYTTGMAGNVKMLYIYDTTSLTDQDTALEFNRWATDNLAQIGNASFGECEFFPYLDGAMVADDQVFLEAAAQGQTMFSSTGDTGSFCSVGTNGVPAGAPFVGYPATSPYVIGVGGTTLVTNKYGRYNSEVAWYAGGGGVSQFEYSPVWQSPVVPTNNGLPVTLRAIPDISMDADPNTGAIVYVNGAVEYIGGTSLSSPLAAGAWARLQTSYNNVLGFAAPRLYAGYPAFGGTAVKSPAGLTQQVDGFNDVLTGTDGLYTALPDYDFTTGLGSLDVGAKQPLLPH